MVATPTLVQSWMEGRAGMSQCARRQPTNETTRDASQMTSSPPAFTPRMIALVRLRLVVGIVSLVSLLSFAMSVVLFVAPTFSHKALLFTAALIALNTNMLASALIEGWRAWLLWHTSAWTGFDGKPRSRAERPWWFATWLTVHVVFAGVYGCAAGFLTWALFAFIL